MRNLLLVITFLPSLAFSQIEVPALLKDSTIVTTLKNGKQYKFDGNEYMVVKRKAKQVAILPAPAQDEQPAKQVISPTKQAEKLNRVRVIGAHGPDGFKSKRSANYVEIKTNEGFLGGVGYDRLINDKISVGGQILSNGTMGVSLGLDF